MSKFHYGAKTWTLRRVWDQSEGSLNRWKEGRWKIDLKFLTFFYIYIKVHKGQLPIEKYKNKSDFI